MVSFVYDIINWEEKQLIKKFKDENLKINLIDAKNNELNLTGKNNIDNIAFIRCLSHKRSLYYSYVLESQNINAINSYNIFNTAGNKLFTSAYLHKNKIPTPETYVSFSKDNAIETSNKIGYPVVFKPVSGSWGRMVSLIKDNNFAETIFSMNDMVNDRIYYLQKYNERPPRDIRAIIVNHEISAIIYRYSYKSWKTNLYLGGKVEKANLDDNDKELLIKTGELFDPGIIGIDAMESDDGLLIHEVNSRVEFRGASKIYGNKIIEDIANFFKDLLKN